MDKGSERKDKEKNGDGKYQELNLYNWQQNTNSVKLIFKIPNLSSLGSNKVKLKVSKGSITLKIMLSESDLKFTLKKLYSSIVPVDTTSIRKSDILTVILKKKRTQVWPRLSKKEEFEPKLELEQVKERELEKQNPQVDQSKHQKPQDVETKEINRNEKYISENQDELIADMSEANLNLSKAGKSSLAEFRLPIVDFLGFIFSKFHLNR